MDIKIPSGADIGEFLTTDIAKPRILDWNNSGGVDPIEMAGTALGAYVIGKGAKAAYNKIRGKKKDMSEDRDKHVSYMPAGVVLGLPSIALGEVATQKLDSKINKATYEADSLKRMYYGDESHVPSYKFSGDAHKAEVNAKIAMPDHWEFLKDKLDLTGNGSLADEAGILGVGTGLAVGLIADLARRKGYKSAKKRSFSEDKDSDDKPNAVDKTIDYVSKNKKPLAIGAGLAVGALALTNNPTVKEKIDKVKQVLFSEERS